MISMQKTDGQLQLRLKEDADLIDSYLSRVCVTDDSDLSPLFEAMRYSLLAGGKRIRPFLVLEVAAAFGVEREAALPYAAALEMIHTYSLIHDDLPAMDKDDYRRGRLTSHKKFGEANAILAGDALLTFAFFIATNEGDPLKNAAAVRVLAKNAGPVGMVGGQIMDLAAENRQIGVDTLKKIHHLKTGALISTAIELGLILSSAPVSAAVAFRGYSERIGQLFQLTDDLLDRYGDSAELGKTTGKDEKAGKNTYLSFYSREQALTLASDLAESASNLVREWDTNGIFDDLAQYILTRRK